MTIQRSLLGLTNPLLSVFASPQTSGQELSPVFGLTDRPLCTGLALIHSAHCLSSSPPLYRHDVLYDDKRPRPRNTGSPTKKTGSEWKAWPVLIGRHSELGVAWRAAWRIGGLQRVASICRRPLDCLPLLPQSSCAAGVGPALVGGGGWLDGAQEIGRAGRPSVRRLGCAPSAN